MAFDPVPYRERIVDQSGKLTTAGIVWFRWFDNLRSVAVASVDQEVLQAVDSDGMNGQAETFFSEILRQSAIQDTPRNYTPEIEQIRGDVAVLDSVTGGPTGSTDSRVAALEAAVARLEATVAAIQEPSAREPSQAQIDDACRSLEPEVNALKAEMAFSDSGLGGASGAATLLKITGGGVDGSMKVENGRVTTLVAPT
jgi:hypothetical protein